MTLTEVRALVAKQLAAAIVAIIRAEQAETETQQGGSDGDRDESEGTTAEADEAGTADRSTARVDAQGLPERR
jgi:hypothetical protein